ncbi:MAG: restriction endonuclease [Planctomycetaceae bacterium]
MTDPQDRDEVIAWFLRAEQILDSGKSTSEMASDLYAILDSTKLAMLVGNTARTSLNSYCGSGMPMSIKAAIPVAVLGSAVFGFQGAGIAAFGTAIGLPVVVILFLGVAGVTAIIEALVKNHEVADPLTKTLLGLMELENKRRASKDLLRVLREDAMVPKKQELPVEEIELITALRKMDPIAFERHVMFLFQAEGYPAAVTLQSNDFGVDGFVTHPDGIVVVQCKRNSVDNPVGRPVVQQFKGVIEEQAAIRGYIVTTGRFTSEARSSAECSSRIILIDAEDLIVWHRTGKVPN